VFITIAFNLFPIGLIWIPVLFLQKRIVTKKIYTRIAAGISFFFLVYFILPIIFQRGFINQMNTGSGTQIGSGIAYLFSKLFNIIATYLQLPIINLAFIFVFAPFISLIYLFFRLRKEDKTKFRLQLNKLTFEYNKSPREMIVEKLTKGGLLNELRLFRSLVILLPIALYLLVTILKIAGIDALNPNDGGLGWFIEIFFIYIATFLYAIQLIKSSKASYEGKFVGEKLENDTYSSLMSVGTPISVLSMLLFIVEAIQLRDYTAFTLVLYVFGYYLMAAFIFVTMVAIFEPIAILILIKIINRVKYKEPSKVKPIKAKVENLGYSLLFGLASILVIFLVSQLVGFLVQGIRNTAPNPDTLYEDNLFHTLMPSIPGFYQALVFEGLSAVSTLGIIILVLGTGVVIGLSYKQNKSLFLNSITILAFLILEAIIFQLLTRVIGGNIFPFFGDPTTTYWVTGKVVTTNVFGFNMITLRTALVDIRLLSDNIILYGMSIPFQYTRYFIAFLLIGLSFHYIRQDFMKKTVKRERFVDHITFAKIDYLPTYEQCQQSNYLLSIPKTYRPSEQDRDEVKRLMYECRNGITVSELLPNDVGERDRLYVTLKYLTKRKNIFWWEPEFSFTNEQAELDSMYTMYEDGRDVFSFKFKESSTADPGLVAGMFSAITSFIKETTKSADLLRTIDHGDTKVIIEYGQYVFGAIFSDRETIEIRSKLKSFVTEFEKRHGDVLKKWDGNCTPFAHDDVLLKEIFEI